jgi:hypothetical protein
MDQVSRPLQIVLVATVALAALWMVALRPKPATAPPSEPSKPAAQSAVPGPAGDALDKARATRAAADARARAADAPAGAAARKVAPSPAPQAPRSAGPAVSPARRDTAPRGRLATPGMVRAALARRQAVVLLFYSGRASDDRAVRSEIDSVSRLGGRVRVWPVAVKGVSRFKNVLRQTQILQTPSVVVLGPASPPRVLTGYVDSFEIDQAAAVSLGA